MEPDGRWPRYELMTSQQRREWAQEQRAKAKAIGAEARAIKQADEAQRRKKLATALGPLNDALGDVEAGLTAVTKPWLAARFAQLARAAIATGELNTARGILVDLGRVAMEEDDPEANRELLIRAVAHLGMPAVEQALDLVRRKQALDAERAAAGSKDASAPAPEPVLEPAPERARARVAARG